MENEYVRLSDAQKVFAIQNMLDYCLRYELPIPQSINHYHPSYVEGTTHLWEFEAKVTPQLDEETNEDFDVRRRAWLKDWIKDVLRKAVESDGVKIEKKWSNELAIILKNDRQNFRIEYSVKRDVVCEKRVTGKKVIPERVVPERVEEEYEWVCEDKSLLDD